jgi:ATP-dependent protease Clp ATPase subunit
MAEEAPDPRTICGWCGKSKDEVKVVAGPITNICVSCCRLAAGILQIIPPEHVERSMTDGANKPPERTEDDDGK